MKRHAVITGGASGIGRATGDLLHEHGWSVLLMDVASPSESLPDGVDFAQIDVVQVGAAAERIRDFCEEGALHALIHSAAIQHTGPTTEVSVATWRRVMSVNVEVVAQLVSGLLDTLEAASGSVINVASVHAVATSSNIGVYAASKGALVALTRALAIELAPRGVRVNAVLPGAVNTPMLRAGVERAGVPKDVALAALANCTPMGRIGEPWEIAEAIRFLADARASSFITGATLVVDGGATARLSTEGQMNVGRAKPSGG